MKEKRDKIDRRNFLKTMGAAGLGSVLAGCKGKEETQPDTVEAEAPERAQEPEYPQLPMRKLGKTGVEVPCLALGTMFEVTEKQIVLIKALQLGVTYWDTAHSYGGGNSELGIGKYLTKNPAVRKKLFIATKASRTQTITDVEQRLQTSLKKMNTNYIDLYYGVHGLRDPAELTNELKQWAKEAKKRGLIRLFGFTTHKNMVPCLATAAKLDWIDVIMTRYNFRYMRDKELNAAIDACHKAGIGLIAMKTQGKKVETEEDKKLISHFLKRGFTEGQAKVKVVLQDKRFSAACVGRDNIAHLTENVEAVLDKTKLTQADMEVFKEYAAATCSGYCAGCANICDSALPDMPYVSDVMRYLMYYNSYDERDNARELFAQIPVEVRSKLLTTDYRLAEARCPQRMPIAKFVAEAVSKLA